MYGAKINNIGKDLHANNLKTKIMSGPFKMKYKNSAFPFKSPLKQDQLFDVTGDESGSGTVHVGPFGSELKKEQEQRRKYGIEFETGSNIKYPNKPKGFSRIVKDIKSTIPKKEDKK